MQPTSEFPCYPSSRQVMARALLRISILAAFASLNSHGFASAFPQFMFLAAAFCAAMAAMRRESVLGPVLTHIDEAATYLLIGGAMSRLS